MDRIGKSWASLVPLDFRGVTIYPKGRGPYMKRTLAAAAIAAITFIVPASAETIDLGTVKCSELATMSEQDASFMFTWLLGYAGGQAGSTLMDLSAMGSIGTQIGEYCAANPDVGLLSASMEILQ
jgi:acid stress chaperone HdeB